MVLNGWYMLMTRRSMQFWLKVIGRQWLIILNIVFLISRNGQLKMTWNLILIKQKLYTWSLPLEILHLCHKCCRLSRWTNNQGKDLGVILDSGLDMQYHVGNKSKSAAMGLHNIGKIRKYLDRGTTEKRVHAFITCHLDNNNVVWHSRYAFEENAIHPTLCCKTNNNQKEKILPNISNSTRTSLAIHKSRIKFKLLTMVFKCIQGSAPVYLQEIIKSYKPKCNLRSNSQNLINQMRVRTKLFGDRAFAKAAPELRNSLPQFLRDITSLDQFKSRLKTFFFLND